MSRFSDAKQEMEARKRGLSADQAKQQILANKLVSDLGKRGEKLLAKNLEANERVLAKLRGNLGQGLAVTNKHVFVVKWGFTSGSTFGGKCVSYAYPNITGIHISKQAVQAMVQVLTPATPANVKLSYWGSRGSQNNAVESDYAVTFGAGDMAAFQEAVRLAREQMGGGNTAGSTDNLDQLEKLATLKQKGVITEQEFQAKKKQLLGL